MSPWLLVRDEHAVEGACRQAKDLLRHGRQGYAANLEIAGILIDPVLAAHPPTRLAGRDRTDSPVTLRVRENVGVAGIWMLCWIEPVIPGRRPSRADVIDAWLGTVAGRPDCSEGLIPVLAIREAPRVRPALRLVDNVGP